MAALDAKSAPVICICIAAVLSECTLQCGLVLARWEAKKTLCLASGDFIRLIVGLWLQVGLFLEEIAFFMEAAYGAYRFRH